MVYRHINQQTVKQLQTCSPIIIQCSKWLSNFTVISNCFNDNDNDNDNDNANANDNDNDSDNDNENDNANANDNEN